jgi:hypothetical protein
MDEINKYVEQARSQGKTDSQIKEDIVAAGHESSKAQKALEANSKAGQASGQAGDVPLLNRTDVPKKWSEFQQLKSLLIGVCIALASPFFGNYVYNKDNHQAGILVGVIGTIFGLILAIGSWVSYRQLRRAEKKPKTHNEFQTSTATEYSAPLASANASTNDEKIVNWLGPIIRADKGSISHSILAKEVLKQAENTLLFTPTQIIAIMLTPEDTKNIQQGAVGSAASAFINYSSDTAGDKNQEFRVLYSRRWDQLIENVKSQPLENVIQTHLNYGIPYSSIKSVKLKKTLVNPGFVFELTDGNKLRFGVYRKDKIKEITEFLRQRTDVLN